MTNSSIHIFQDKAWYFLSIYYSRDKWGELISRIMQFYTIRQEQFSDCLVSLSEERGEHIQVAFISPDCKRNYQHEIAVFFQSYIDTNPSISIDNSPYGKTLWCNYPNNTLTWDRFVIRCHDDWYISFHQKTFRLALRLLDNDFSFDNILSIALYLAIKGLTYIDTNMQNNVLSNTLNKIANSFSDYSSIELTLQLIIDRIGKQNICEIIESYWREDGSEYSSELIEWFSEGESMKKIGFMHFCFKTCNILGLNELRPILILKLLDTWQGNFYTTVN